MALVASTSDLLLYLTLYNTTFLDLTRLDFWTFETRTTLELLARASCLPSNMLRLLPTEIAITPEDIRIVNERIDQHKRAKARVKLHPGPERSRDRAVTNYHPRGITAHRAEVSDEDEALHQSQGGQARARIGLGMAGSQPRRPSQIMSAALRPPQSKDQHLSMRQRLEHAGLIPFQNQVDGPDESEALHLSEESSLSSRDEPSGSQLRQARALSAPAMPQVMMSAVAPRPHARQPLSDGAIAFHADLLAFHARERPPGESPASNPEYAQDCGYGAPIDIAYTRQVGVGPAMEVNPFDASSPSTVRAFSRLSPPAYPYNSSDDSLSSGSSSSSSAAEAAAADRPSPLESISQQAAMAHSRLASATRRRSVPRNASSAGIRPASGRQPVERVRHQAGHDPRSRDNYTEGVAAALEIRDYGTVDPGPDTGLDGSHEIPARTSISVSRSAIPRSLQAPPMRHQPLPIRSREDLSRREQSSSSGARPDPPTRHPIPPRHSSRTTLSFSHVFLMFMLNSVQGFILPWHETQPRELSLARVRRALSHHLMAA